MEDVASMESEDHMIFAGSPICTSPNTSTQVIRIIRSILLAFVEQIGIGAFYSLGF